MSTKFNQSVGIIYTIIIGVIFKQFISIAKYYQRYEIIMLSI